MDLFSKLNILGDKSSADTKPEKKDEEVARPDGLQASSVINNLPRQEDLEDDLLHPGKSDETRMISPNNIREIYEQIDSGAGEASWLLLKFSDIAARGKVIYLAASGTDYDDFLKLLCDDSHIAYGFAKVQYTTAKKTREKINVLICWVGKYTKLTEKAGVLVDREYIIEMLKNHHKLYVTGLKSEIVMKRITFNAQLGRF
ncbi:uncharacterized protein LOC135496050 [Lineus longissimus]|uniref:uncharacterized protein LOC135496050 n=1 Tax=Lineus longissimus TaxID=88925 RepID=UPI00315DCA93